MNPRRPSLLIVLPEGAPESDRTKALSEALGDRYEIIVTTPGSLSERTPSPDLVVSDVSTLPKIAGSLAAELENDRAITLLNAINEGVCLATAEGDVLWSNRFFQRLDDQVADSVAGACRVAAGYFRELETVRPGSVIQRPGAPDPAEDPMDGPHCRFETTTADGQRFYEAIVTPVAPMGLRGADGESTGDTHIAAVVRDVTAQRRIRQKMNAVDAAGTDLVGVGCEELEDLNAVERLQQLEQKITGHMQELLKFDNFAIFLVDSKRDRLELVISAGLPDEINDLNFYLQSEGSGITGMVATSGNSYICQDAESDPLYVPGLVGCSSSLTVPLKLNEEVIGVLAIESQQSGAFTEEDRQFAEIFARHVAVALHLLDLLVAERTTVNRSVSGRVKGELDEPLEDIMHEAETILGDLRVKDPDAASHVDRIKRDVESIRKRVADVAAGPQTLLGVEHALKVRSKDPLISGRRVLVADDALKIRRIIGDVLGNRGMEVVTVEDGAAAIERLHAVEHDEIPAFDLVISDIQMPGANGYEVFSASKKQTSQLPVILMTGFGYDPHHSIVRASQEGLQAVLFKPFQIEQLIEQVRKVFQSEHAAS